MKAGDVRALARAISLVENGADEAEELLALCRPAEGPAMLVGITGPPGAGKSTLVDQMARSLRSAGRSVGIVAVDPTSPYSGGALLGDRIRMQGFAGDDGMFIRSLASRGARGGLTAEVRDVCTLLAASGRQVVLIETMGVGQDEVAVAAIADLTILVLVPGMGDDVQSLKAGIMEAADIYVINKADREGADRMESEIKATQSLAGGKAAVVPVFKTVATEGSGVAELLAAIALEYPTTRAGKLRVPLNRGGADGAIRLDHVGIAVRSIASSRVFYEAMGLRVGSVEVVEHERVNTAMLTLGESRLELLEPLAEDSVLGRFLSKRGEGLHHIAIHTVELEAKFQAMQKRGVRLASDSIRVGAGGHRYFFVHPESTGGVLVEVVGDAAGPAKESGPCA